MKRPISTFLLHIKAVDRLTLHAPHSVAVRFNVLIHDLRFPLDEEHQEFGGSASFFGDAGVEFFAGTVHGVQRRVEVAVCDDGGAVD